MTLLRSKKIKSATPENTHSIVSGLWSPNDQGQQQPGLRRL